MSRSNAALRASAIASGPGPDSAEAQVDTLPSVADSVGPAVASPTGRGTGGHGTRRATGTPRARIYQRGKSPLQSGRARKATWFLAFEPRQRTAIDTLMGWTSTRDTLQQVELHFSTLEEAVAFAERRGLQYLVETPREREKRPKSYADNFRHDRLIPWTH